MFTIDMLASSDPYQDSMGKGDKRIEVWDFVSMYFDKERFAAFRRKIGLSTTGQEEGVILEICS